MPIPIAISTTCVRTLPRSSSSTTIATGCIRRWATIHRKSSSRRLVRRPLRPEPPCGFSGLEHSFERHHQLGIRLQHQRRGEEHHSINHQVCLFQTVSTEGFTPHNCAHFVLNATSLQLIPAYCSPNSGFAQSLAGVGLSEPEQAGVGSRKRFPKPLVGRSRLPLPFHPGWLG